MIIPIGTNTPLDRKPTANYALIAINVVIFAFSALVLGGNLTSLQLNAQAPGLHQFITYQFLHANTGHLLGNMLFLWVFGNSVNARLGHLTYVLFYLGGGVAAGVGYTWTGSLPLLGASGSVAAVTTAFLMLFPRSLTEIIYWFFFIGRFEIPSMLLIVLKIILYDNIIEPKLAGPTNVAYSAHLAGYAFGCVATVLMLWLRVVVRSQFDVLALLRRAYLRRQMAWATATPDGKAKMRYGRMARPVEAAVAEASPAQPEQPNPTDAIKHSIGQALSANDRTTATELYTKLIDLDAKQVLSRQQQLDVANQFTTLGRYVHAAEAYEKLLTRYTGAPDAEQVHLLLGIIYTRHLGQYSPALPHLQAALPRLKNDRQRNQCLEFMATVQSHLPEEQAGVSE